MLAGPTPTLTLHFLPNELSPPFSFHSHRGSNRRPSRSNVCIWGPAQVDSIGGRRYYMSVDGGGSSWCQAFSIPDKEADTTLSALDHLKRQAESVTSPSLKTIRTDQMSEFKNAKWEEFCAAEGIIQVLYPPTGWHSGAFSRFTG